MIYGFRMMGFPNKNHQRYINLKHTKEEKEKMLGPRENSISEKNSIYNKK